MNLIRTDGDGLIVISDIGKEYHLNVLKPIGADGDKTTDIVAIVYRSDLSEDEEIIGFFYGADIENIKHFIKSSNYIRDKINAFEERKFDISSKYGDLLEIF